MAAPKSRPAVTITTYSANNSSYLKSKQEQEEEHATRCEFSTNLFRNNIRRLNNSSGLDQRSHQTPHLGTSRGRGVLSDLSQIRGPTGSVRGHKDVVRKSLEGIKVTYSNRFMNFTSSSSATSYSSSTSSSGGSSLVSFSTFFATQSARINNNLASLNQQAPKLTSFTSTTIKPRSSMANSSLLTIDNELYCSEYLERLVEEEQNLCVAYTTTLGVIRRTFEDSKMMKSILNLNLVKYEERDIYLNQEYKYQLKVRAGSIVVPALFVDGVHIGGAKEVETMNENGELQKLLANFKMSRAPSEVCYCCGNAKFIACQSCNGSRKSAIHHFKFNSVALRCIKCDKNDGLVPCPVCCSGVSPPANRPDLNSRPIVSSSGENSISQPQVCNEFLKPLPAPIVQEVATKLKLLTSIDEQYDENHLDKNNNYTDEVEC